MSKLTDSRVPENQTPNLARLDALCAKQASLGSSDRKPNWSRQGAEEKGLLSFPRMHHVLRYRQDVWVPRFVFWLGPRFSQPSPGLSLTYVDSSLDNCFLQGRPHGCGRQPRLPSHDEDTSGGRLHPRLSPGTKGNCPPPKSLHRSGASPHPLVACMAIQHPDPLVSGLYGSWGHPGFRAVLLLVQHGSLPLTYSIPLVPQQVPPTGHSLPHFLPENLPLRVSLSENVMENQSLPPTAGRDHF